jgi:integrase/recombinase XerD
MDVKSYIFLRKDQTNKQGENTIYLRLLINNIKKDFSLKLTTKPEYWDEKEANVNKKHPIHAKMSLLIKTQQQKADNIIIDAELLGSILTFEEFERLFKGSSEKESFIEFAKRYYKENPQNLSKETLRTYNTDISELEKYKSNVTFKEINHVSFISNYEKFLLSKETAPNKTTAPNTVYKKLKLIRAVLKIAKKQKLIQSVAFDDYSIKFYKTDKVFFTKTELEKLENLLSDNRIKIYQLKVLEYFLFGCYTGLRISDISDLKYKNIIEKEHLDKQSNTWISRKYISVKMKKTENSTGEIVEIPLMEIALKLAGTGLPEDKIFQARENPAEVVKEIVKLAGINKNANFHSSRHSFAVLFLASGGDISH